jgi:hypothetical protein
MPELKRQFKPSKIKAANASAGAPQRHAACQRGGSELGSGMDTISLDKLRNYSAASALESSGDAVLLCNPAGGCGRDDRAPQKR